jgi:hypothetical protein
MSEVVRDSEMLREMTCKISVHDHASTQSIANLFDSNRE